MIRKTILTEGHVTYVTYVCIDADPCKSPHNMAVWGGGVGRCVSRGREQPQKSPHVCTLPCV